MKVVVYPHLLSIGGSQLNAIEIAGAVRDLGHDVTVFGPSGPLVATVEALRPPFVEAPPVRWRPSERVMSALTDHVRREGVDIVHAYEWPPTLEAYYGPFLRSGVGVVATTMSMSVAPFIPRSIPLVVGTREIAEATRRAGHLCVEVIEPPVDTELNRPSVASVANGSHFEVNDTTLHVVCVSRLAVELKLEGLQAAIEAVGRLAENIDVLLTVVGDGPARQVLERQADDVNRRAGRVIVRLTGEVLDPRPAYESADVVLGMGGSALRGMAFGKPVVVQGEAGFWEVLTPETVDQFLWHGWYGVGGGEPGAELLVRHLRSLAGDPEARRTLGAFARSLVCDRFSLRVAGAAQASLYERALESPVTRRRAGVEAVVAGTRFTHREVARRLARFRGSEAEDDCNSPAAIRRVAVAARGHTPSALSHRAWDEG